MASLLRIARFVVVSAVSLAALGVLPATAQFNPFEALFGSPPRPPSGVPGGRQQPPPQQQGYPQQQAYPQYPDQRYDQRSQDPRYQEQYPDQARQGPPGGGIQTQPLPPPPGGAAAAVPGMGPPPVAGLPPGPLPPGALRPPRGGPQPADTSPQPGDEVIPEPPSQKIANKGALFSGLDKITGRIINFDIAVGETVQFGALQVTPRICYTRPPTEAANTDAFIEVDEVTLQGEVKRIFSGWVFASSPGLHAVEHPIYDVWLTDCKNPVVAAAPPPEPPAPAAAPATRPAAAPKRPAPGPQLAPPGTIPRR